MSVPSAYAYVRASLSKLGSLGPLSSPWTVHQVENFLISLLPASKRVCVVCVCVYVCVGCVWLCMRDQKGSAGNTYVAFIIGTKADLTNKRQVNAKEAEEYCATLEIPWR